LAHSVLARISSHTNRKVYVTVISTVVSKLKDVSRSQAVLYAVKLVISRKQCKYTLLLQTTNIHGYRIAAFADDFNWIVHLLDPQPPPFIKCGLADQYFGWLAG